MEKKTLEKIGLTEKEALVYLALLELGAETVQSVANKSGVNRATVYVVLDSLRKRGLASTVEQKGKTNFIAASPEELLRLVRLQEAEVRARSDEVRAMMPELKSIYNLAKNKPVVRFYEGYDGIEAMQSEFHRTRGADMVSIYSRDLLEKTFSADEIIALRDVGGGAQSKTVRSIYTAKKGRIPDEKGKVRRRISEKKYPLSSDIAVFGDVVRIASFEKGVSGILIQDRGIANTLRTLFELAWASSAKSEKENRIERTRTFTERRALR
jgi:HTH-type transcriptional regulator, sugar sensing transcriptional regulator